MLFNKCSKPVLLELCRSFCTVFYCPYFWTNYKKTTFSKIRVAYNNVYRKILGVSRRSSGSAMTNDIPNFEAFLRNSIYSFTTRISFSHNNLICAIEQSWVMKTIWKLWEEKCTSKPYMQSFVYFYYLYFMLCLILLSFYFI